MTPEENARTDTAELANELETARNHVAELEARLASMEEGTHVRRQERQPLEADIEFIGDFDIIGAKGIDLSEGGICFEVSEPLTFEMRFDVHQQTHNHRAQLVWVSSLSTGGYHLGFKFIPPQSEPSF